MSTRVAIVGEPAIAGIAGLDGQLDWGEAATVSHDEALPEPAPEIVVALGAADPAPRRAPDVRWLAGPRAAGDGDARHLVATAGEGLWSRAPLPVRDELFDLAAPGPGAGVVVVTPDEARDAPLIDRLSSWGLLLQVEPELSADGLAAAATVAFAPTVRGDGRLWGRDETVPGAAFAVLAARRFLIVPRAHVAFGLLPGVDHLAASTDDEVVQYADALHAFPESFALQAALGRVAAERQRASAVYGRLALDLAAASTAARRSAAPRG